ncbi:type VI secretion system amidase effector protein Tae4 [Acinetobacter dispersus]|uniref:type VI secretion system amidase effector protein Tae4 n=1 Tax=Acinetobacter dispersus TaxID=70348 RepID=UPI003C2ACEEA
MPVNQTGKVQTNPKRGSVAACSMTGIVPVTFKELWSKFASGSPPYQVNGSAPKGFENQCAIRMSKTLHNVGVKMSTFSQNNIKPEGKAATLGRILLNGMPTATRANEMAKWLDTRPVCGIAAKQVITGPNWKDKINGRTGIIFFGEYWGRDGEDEGNASGGHIDLWNKTRITGTGSYFRIQWGIVINGIWSDFSKSKRIWFYEVK